MGYMLEIQNIHKTFNPGTINEKVALNGVNLNLNPGDFVTIIGGNGAGKSTTLNAIAGVWSVDEGKIIIDGVDITKLSEHKRALYLGRVFQDPMTALNPLKKIGSQIEEVIIRQRKCSKNEAKEKALEMLKKVGISNPEVRLGQYPHEFSGGMRQRVVIAIAVACNPQILICDEPTTALDVTIQAQILELLKEMRVKYNLTIILITHDLGVVANIADRVAVMYAGDIVEIGTSDEIYYDPRHPYTWALLSSMPQMGVKGEDLFNIQGTPPNLFTEIHGDAFAPRNPLALKIDFVKRPPYFDVSTTHRAKTWLLDPRAPKIEPPAAVRMLQEEGK